MRRESMKTSRFESWRLSQFRLYRTRRLTRLCCSFSDNRCDLEARCYRLFNRCTRNNQLYFGQRSWSDSIRRASKIEESEHRTNEERNRRKKWIVAYHFYRFISQSQITSFRFVFYRWQLPWCTLADKLCKRNEMSAENTGTITPVWPRMDSWPGFGTV